MVLNDLAIREAIERDNLIELIDKPYAQYKDLYEASIQPASYDLTLSRNFKKIKKQDCIYPNKTYVDFDEPCEVEDVPYVSSTHEGVIIRPGEFLLGASNEIINLPIDVAAFVCGRSSIGRLGLIIETAGFVDPNFTGSITLEIANLGPNPIRLLADTRIAQLVFFKMTDKAAYGYHGKYQGQIEATGSRLYMDF